LPAAQGSFHCVAARQPLRDHPVIDPIHGAGSVALDEGPGALAVVDIRGFLRPGEQRIGRPPLPETMECHSVRADIPKARSRLLARPLRLGLRGKRPGTAKDARHAHVPPEHRVVDLRPPATRGQLSHPTLYRISGLWSVEEHDGVRVPVLDVRIGDHDKQAQLIVSPYYEVLARFQHTQPLLQPQLPLRDPHQELDTHLTTPVIHRLSLKPLHNNKFATNPTKPLLWKPHNQQTQQLNAYYFAILASEPTSGLEPETSGLQNRCSAN
jgi:hypothetical protein